MNRTCNDILKGDRDMNKEEEWLATFPNRVWYEVGDKWASREPTKEDQQRRKEFAARMANAYKNPI